MQKRILFPGQWEEPPAPLLFPAPQTSSPPVALHFVLEGVAIQGNTVFDAGAFAPLYAEYLAHEVDLEDLTLILERITAKYRAEGYFLSLAVAPPQSLEDGVLRITVIEGYVERVTLKGGSPEDDEQLRPYFDAVLASRPLRLAPLERAILLVNDLPGLHVRPSLRALDEQAGAYELVLGLDKRAYDGFASIDNRGPESLGPWQAQLSADTHSLLGAFDRAQLSLFTIPNAPRDLIAAELLYERPIGSDGTRASLSAARTNLRPEGNLASLALKGTAMRYIASLAHPLLRSREQSLWMSAVFDALDSREHESGALLFDDRLRVLRGTVNYAVTDGLGGFNSLYGEVSRGLTILGASRTDAAALSRSNGHPDFTKAALSATRQQTLGGDLSAQIAVAGQKAVEPLLTSEQFPLGGAHFGRAYDPAEITGDDGLAGSLELRYGRSVESPVLRAYQIYGFYDAGAVWNMGVSDATRRETLASLGGGIRIALPRAIDAAVEIARPLTRSVAAEGGKPLRVFVSLSASF